MPRLLLIGLGTYMIATLFSAVGFSVFATPNSTAPVQIVDENTQTQLGALLAISPTEPKDQACPINGQLFTQTERNAWEQRRPLAVMIENHTDARPQSGLSRADAVYEMVAEGAITRFMAIFYCDAQRDDVILAPIRSARTYFLDYASGYNFPMYVHVGGANIPGPTDALGQIGDYGWALENDVNLGFSFGLPYYTKNANRLGREVATEHQGQSSTELLWKLAKEKREWTNIAPERFIAGKKVAASDWKDGYTPHTFSDEPVTPGTVNSIAHEFWSGFGSFAVVWTYDPATNTYKRVMGGEPHLDQNTGEQIAVSNVIIIQTDEKGPINEAKHMLYGTTGTGKALIFKNGEAIVAKWSKPKRESQLTFLDSKGNEIALTRGKQWISVLDKNTPITY